MVAAPIRHSKRSATYMTIPSMAISNALMAFFASSLPTVGETVDILGSAPYSFPRSCFKFIDLLLV